MSIQTIRIGKRRRQSDESAEGPPMVVRRAEMSLARDDRFPLGAVGLKHDPMTFFAQQLQTLDPERGETAEVRLDLLPQRADQAQRRRSRIEKRDKGSGSGSSGGSAATFDELADVAKGRPPKQSRRSGPTYRRRDPYAVSTLGARTTTQRIADTVYTWDPTWKMQVLIRVSSPDRGRAQTHLMDLVNQFGTWTGLNSIQQVGLHIGPLYLGGANAPWNRVWFDRRFTSGRCSPRKNRVVPTAGILGMMKPPTKKCKAPSVLRSGGLVPPPPRALPTYSAANPSLMPLGWIKTEIGERPVGVPWDPDTVFSITTGRARFGKTESALTRFLAAALAGTGCLFLDPHSDAIERVKPYLTAPDIARRVVEINLTPRGRHQRQAGWNLFDMQDRTADHIEFVVGAVVQSFSSTLKWGEVNNRAITLTTMAAQAMCELALILPPECAPTLFQMTTILSTAAWREKVTPYLSPVSQEYWSESFDRLPEDAVTPVTNLLYRLRSSSTTAALFGSSRSTYNIRRIMDAGGIVLACPAAGGDKSRLIANFIVYDLFHALLSRRDMDPDMRRAFHAWVDEIQVIDGAAGDTMADMVREVGKFKGRLHVMLQQPSTLRKETLAAILTNRSHMFTTTVAATEADILAREWAGLVKPATLLQIKKYNFIGSVQLNGDPSPPFRFRGFSLPDMWADQYHPERLPELDAVIDETSQRRPVQEVLAELDTLNDRILEALPDLHPGRGAAPPPSAEEPEGSSRPRPQLRPVSRIPPPRLGR